ncbi:MAG: hypothetical protein JXX14_04845 [Deltaproteobacteria bacterium]|nr:hypothetical protein [Deltaproteobacteria bacterium]
MGICEKIVNGHLLSLVGYALTMAIIGPACTSPSSQTESHQQRTTCQGIIVATASRFISEPGNDPFEQFDFIAMFPRYQTANQPMVASLLETHVPLADLPLDTCASPEPQFSDKTDEENQISVSLLDAGDMFVKVDGKNIAIPTRTFPDLLKVIDGVIYSASPTHGIEFVPGQTYTVKNTGADNIGSFEVVLEAPNDLGEITVAGTSPDDNIPTILSGTPTVITWEGEGYGDEVIADINWSDMGLTWATTCRMKDDGSFVIPADITRQMGSELTRQTHELRLSRVRQVSFAAPFITFGDFSFVASTSFPVEFDKIN